MTKLYFGKIFQYKYRYEWIIFWLSLMYGFYWLLVSPIQYNGDSDSYISIGRMLLGHVGAIFRTPGYPLLLVLSGAIIPGTFIPLLFIQAIFAAIIPIIIYHILLPYGEYLAFISAVIAIFTGTITAHISQIMTEPLFTLLLYLGIFIAIMIVRNTETYKTSFFYWLALTFAFLNTVRPFAWLIFWPLLLLITYFLWTEKRLFFQLKSIIGSALLFMTLMTVWTIVDDVLFSFGARYSPALSLKSKTDNFLEIYLYDLPFYEAYFDPWRKRISHINENPNIFGQLTNRPNMQIISNIVLQYIIKNKKILLTDTSAYSYQLFRKYANNPKQLADKMFASPNYSYANFIKAAMEQSENKKTRLLLYYNAAKEADYNWPKRWFKLFYYNPYFLLIGPSHGDSSQKFLLAYTSLRHYIPNPMENKYQSLVNPNNGEASNFLFTAVKEGLKNHPELWRDTESFFNNFIDNPNDLTQFIINNPNQTYAWDITRMLWDLMGYHTMNELLTKVTSETFSLYKASLVLRIWDNIINTAVGPGYIKFDNLAPQFGKIEIYDYLETSQMTEREKKELQFTKNRYSVQYKKWQSPVETGYFLFYLLKPFFLCTSIIALSIIWACKQPLIIPIILLLPYAISIIIYGTLFTALPRYTDPTLLFPFLITIIAIPESLRVWKERTNKILEINNGVKRKH